MGGAADFPERASSPLKRRASSMEPIEPETGAKEDGHKDDGHLEGDVDMITAPADVSSEAAPVAKLEESRSEPAVSQPPESVEAHIKSIRTFCEEFDSRPLEEGDEAYVVSRKWVESVIGNSKDTKKDTFLDPASVRPVDNSDIIWEVLDDPCVGKTAPVLKRKFVRLKPVIGPEHFTLFPATAWELVMQWPGLAAGQVPILRVAHRTSENEHDPNIQLEMHPPVFTIYRLWSAHSPLPIKQILKSTQPPPARLARCRTFTWKAFLSQCKQQTDIDLAHKVRVWRVPRKLPASGLTADSAPTPPASPSTQEPDSPDDLWPHMLLDVASFTALDEPADREKIEFRDVTVDQNYNGHVNLEKLSLSTDQAIVLDEHISGTTFVSTFTPSQAASASLPVTRASSTSHAVNRATRSGRTSPAPSGVLTRGRTQKSGRTIGCTGLGNLGNTCYMNSALQCVRSVEELTKYFLTEKWKQEVNPDNVLGHNGDVAGAYALLLKEIYKEPPPSSITPRHFKSTLGRYAPAFSGYGQQDSQEFVGFLLDGLQEDLSRVKKKPYIEKPDSTDEMINDPRAIREMAEQVWDITKRRDDSVVADLFTGLYKSTLVCPDPSCGKISITFDPFNSLTLPMPIENKWSHTIKFFPLNDRPVDIRVELDKSSSIKKLKEFISSRTGVPVERLHGAEEWKNKFYKQYANGACASEEIGNNDNGWFYELDAAPSNWNSAESKKFEGGTKARRSLLEEAEDPGAEVYDAMLVPVMHRVSVDTAYGGKRRQITLTPHFIVLNPDESRNEDIIRRKILQKVATLTKHDFFARRDDADSSDATEFANDSSSSEGKIVAQSVQGEDDMIDITMRDASDSKASSDGETKTHIKHSFNQTPPAWVDPKEHLPAELQNIFEMCYFQENGSLLVSGFNTLNDSTDYPTLSSRAPATSASDDGGESETNSTASNDEESPDELSQPSTDMPLTRMTEEEESEEDEAPIVKVFSGKWTKRGNSQVKLQRRRSGSLLINTQIPHRPKASKINTKSANGQKKMKPHKKYGKKGNKRAQRQAANAARKQQVHKERVEVSSPIETVDSGVDGGPLIRLREAIVVEWNENAYEALFGNSMGTWTSCETMPDPVLDKAVQFRARRKKNGISLEDCLDEFEREEVLSENDTWYCPRCKQHQRASKKFDLWKTPDILVMHLKRFSSSGWRREKLDILVDFPIEGLDLTKRVLQKETGKTEIYDLIGVDCHWGGLGGGHYTAHAKNFVDGQWYSYNDSSVSKANPEKIVDSSAYLLFYRRRSDVPLGGAILRECVEAYGNPESDEDIADAGEGRRLDEGSSPIGSSSAFQEQGLEANHQRQQGIRGGRSIGSKIYSSNSDHGTVHLSGATYDDDQTLRRSIEDDEGIDMTENPTHTATNAYQQTWDFNMLTAENMSQSNRLLGSSGNSVAATDEAQHDSSGDEAFSSRGNADQDMEMDNILDVSQIGPSSTADPPAYPGEGTSPPVYSEGVSLGDKVHEITAKDEDQKSEEAVEIRLGEIEEKAKLG